MRTHAHAHTLTSTCATHKGLSVEAVVEKFLAEAERERQLALRSCEAAMLEVYNGIEKETDVDRLASLYRKLFGMELELERLQVDV